MAAVDKPQMQNCADESIPQHCADRFEKISRSLGKIDRMSEDVTTLRRAVVGNGNAESSLTFRLRKLEDDNRNTDSRKRRWGERAWKLVVGGGLVVFGYWIKS